MAEYVVIALWRKKSPALAQGIELLLSDIGFIGGIKLCWLVASGELSKLIEAKPPGVLSNISSEDVVYFAIGGIALAWVSIESIAKRLLALFPNSCGEDNAH